MLRQRKSLKRTPFKRNPKKARVIEKRIRKPKTPTVKQAKWLTGKKYRDMMAQVILRDGPHCWYCWRELLPTEQTLDHMTPQVSGGTHELDNLRLACKSCNCKKSTNSYEWAMKEAVAWRKSAKVRQIK